VPPFLRRDWRVALPLPTVDVAAGEWGEQHQTLGVRVAGIAAAGIAAAADGTVAAVDAGVGIVVVTAAGEVLAAAAAADTAVEVADRQMPQLQHLERAWRQRQTDRPWWTCLLLLLFVA